MLSPLSMNMQAPPFLLSLSLVPNCASLCFIHVHSVHRKLVEMLYGGLSHFVQKFSRNVIDLIMYIVYVNM